MEKLWCLGGDDEAKINKFIGGIVDNNVRLAIGDFIKVNDFSFTPIDGRGWLLASGSADWDIWSKGWSLRRIFTANVEADLCEPEEFDGLIADLEWCLAHTKKIRARAEKVKVAHLLAAKFGSPA